MKFIIPVSFTPEKIRNEIISLAEENQCSELARVRVSVFRGNGDLFGTYGEMEYTIECNTIGKQGNQFNRDGLEIGTYSEHRKATGSFSNLKSANFHPYSLAALFAKENQWDDCLVLNSSGNITDTTIANLFVIQGDSISTPSLEEGCVNGVMRGYLLRELKTAGYMVRETSIAPPALENAEACFLTNAVRGISWVKKYGTKTFDPGKPAEIYDRFIKPLFGKPK